MKSVVAIGRYVFIFVVFLLIVSLAGNTFTYFNFDPNYSFLKLKQEAIATGWYLPAYYSHVLISGIILVAGFFQLFPKSSSKYKRIHRAMGYLYVMGIIFFAAPGGIVMSLFIGRGPWVLASFITLSILWFFFTSRAFSEIRKRNIAAHKQWMWRSYALTFSAVTLRLYIFITSYSIDLNNPEAYATLAWLSWVPNLVVVEFLIINRSAFNANRA
jgi:uncharacterized membrane protein